MFPSVFLLILLTKHVTALNDQSLSIGRSILSDLLLLDPNRITSKLFRPSAPRPSLFHVVKFPNDECVDLSNQIGTCYTQLQCKAFGGSGTAVCAKGYGTCCIISRSCHNSTSQKVVYFTNPSFPSMDKSENYCDLTVEVKDPDVCQLRVDFLDFQIDQPTSGSCVNDKLRITVSGLTIQQVPILCGTIKNSHVYLHLPNTPQDRSVGFLFETNQNGSYRWHLRITQVDCGRNVYGSRMRKQLEQEQNHHSRKRRSLLITNEALLRITPVAPTGCLQYFTARSGMIESFNFGQYLNNLDYAICIEHSPMACKIKFQAGDHDFFIEPAVQMFNSPSETLPLGVQGDQACADDYLMIPGGSADGEYPTKDRYCGGRLQSGPLLNDSPNPWQPQTVVSKATGPIVLRFHSDSMVPISTSTRIGFRIKYEQLTSDCSPMLISSTPTSTLSSSSSSSSSSPASSSVSVSPSSLLSPLSASSSSNASSGIPLSSAFSNSSPSSSNSFINQMY